MTLGACDLRLNRTSQCPQRFLTVEQADVFRLGGGKAADRPGEVHEVRLVWGHHRVHPAFLRKVIALPGVAGAAGGHHVGPVVIAAAREWNEMVPRQALAMAQIGLSPVTVLAAVSVSSEEECVGDLTAEAAGDVNEFDEPNYCRSRQCQPFTSNDVAPVRFHNLGFTFDHQAKRTTHRDHGQWLEGCVQRQTPHAASPSIRRESLMPLVRQTTRPRKRRRKSRTNVG
jgi:hypothetical protein